MAKDDLLPTARLFSPYAKIEEMQQLPLRDKIHIAQKNIIKWRDHFSGKVYVSFSGGKDSTVLLHLVRGLFPDVPAVFIDTGLEYPEIRDFVKTFGNVEWVKPKMRFDRVIEKYGYPVISKEQSRYIRDLRHGKDNKKTRDIRLSGSAFSLSKKWRYLVDAPFKISEQCCDVLKKRPIKIYEKFTGRVPYIGTMADESRLRKQQANRRNCNAFRATRPDSRPLTPWMEADIWAYIKKYNIPYSKIYDMGYSRTGCMFCAFGAHMEVGENRFDKMAKTHPAQHDYCMRRLGMAIVLDYIGVSNGIEKKTAIMECMENT